MNIEDTLTRLNAFYNDKDGSPREVWVIYPAPSTPAIQAIRNTDDGEVKFFKF